VGIIVSQVREIERERKDQVEKDQWSQFKVISQMTLASHGFELRSVRNVTKKGIAHTELDWKDFRSPMKNHKNIQKGIEKGNSRINT
jgi:hypothetical protein